MVRCTRSKQAWITARQWGKSHAARARVKQRLLSQAGYSFLYVVPYYSQGSTSIYLDLISSPELAPRIVRKKIQPFCQFWLSNGSYFQLRCWNTNPQALRSQTVSEVFFDEIQNAEHTEDFWPVLGPLTSIAAARQAGGIITIAGQFRGKENWYYRDFFLPGTDPNSTTHRSWKEPWNTGLFFQTPAGREYIAHQKSVMLPVDFQQEYECEPTANRRAAFPASDVAYIIRGTVPIEPSKDTTRVIGVDVGKERDPAACCVMEVKTGLVCHSETFPLGQEHSVSAEMAARQALRWKCGLAVIDATGGGAGGKSDSVIDRYRAALRPICLTADLYWTGRQQQKVVRNAQMMLQDAHCAAGHAFKLSVPPVFTGLVSQLYGYEFEARKGGAVYYGAAPGSHDDECAAFLQCLWAIQTNMISATPNTGGMVRVDTATAKRV